VSERKSDARSVINTVTGMYDKYFPMIPGSVSIGINAASVVIVPEIIGGAYSRIAIRIACFGLYPSCTFLFDHSITTIIVSIATQRLKIREKFVRKFSENPVYRSTVNVIRYESGTIRIPINPSLKPINIRSVRNTRPNVVIIFLKRSTYDCCISALASRKISYDIPS